MGTLAEMLSTPLGVIEWFVYLLAAVMFVIGLHLMNSPKTARKGNMVSAVGMILAVVAQCCPLPVENWKGAFCLFPFSSLRDTIILI